MKPVSLLLVTFLLVACGDDDVPPPPPNDAAPSDSNRPRRDTGDPGDADPGDTAVADTGGDSATDECSMTALDIPMDVIGNARPVAVEFDSEGFVVAYRGTGDDADLFLSTVAADATAVTTTPHVAELGSVRNVAIGGGLAVWEDDLNERIEKTIRAYPTRPASGDEIVEVTSQTDDARAPQVARFDGGNWIIGYFKAAGGAWEITVRSWDGTSLGPERVLDTVPDVSQVSLAQSGDEMMVAWQRGGDVLIRPLGTDAAPAGDAEVISTENNAVGPVQIAFHESGGAAVFQVSLGGRLETRSRLLNVDGTPRRAEQVVSLAPPQGGDANIVTFTGGFAVVYRQRTIGSDVETVQLNFVHGSDGDVVFELPLGESGFSDGLPDLAVAPDGEILVAWANVEGGGTAIRAMKVSCPVAWLRCSPMGSM